MPDPLMQSLVYYWLIFYDHILQGIELRSSNTPTHDANHFFSPSLKISRLKIVFDNVGQRDRDEIGRKWESKDDEDLSDAAAAAYLHFFRSSTQETYWTG